VKYRRNIAKHRREDFVPTFRSSGGAAVDAFLGSNGLWNVRDAMRCDGECIAPDAILCRVRGAIRAACGGHPVETHNGGVLYSVARIEQVRAPNLPIT
jgi:hypothetical protein